jgi:DNA/RNA-binding domain of Phe-tRNA-synthetase-like protein
MRKTYTIEIPSNQMNIGILEAEHLKNPQNIPFLQTEMQKLLDVIRTKSEYPPAPLKKAVRDMLRHGKFKPTGRSKPASEFLIGLAVRGDSFPFINAVVDINNYISLKSCFPLSVFDMDKTDDTIYIRWGNENERYVFNPSGQEIDVTDLVVVADQQGNRAIGSPIKDSMATKVYEDTQHIFFVVYAPPLFCDTNQMTMLLEEIQQLLITYCQSSTCSIYLSNPSTE